MLLKILTHRGLDPSRGDYFQESTKEAFGDQLERGFGLEFDIQLTKDSRLVIMHDNNFRRISGGKDERKICDVNSEEILKMDFSGCHIAEFRDILNLIKQKQSSDSISAIHLKFGSQKKKILDLFLEKLKGMDLNQFIIFDVTLETAAYLKRSNPFLHLAPSVSHSYDIERYNSVTGGTLYPLEKILPYRELFDWVWLDEWDLSNTNGRKKDLYNRETFLALRDKKFSIGLISPELHATSPGLLGGESHQDAANIKTLTERIRKILFLGPDLICTDYPDLIRNISRKLNF